VDWPPGSERCWIASQAIVFIWFIAPPYGLHDCGGKSFGGG
jgi:hypothetical protein